MSSSDPLYYTLHVVVKPVQSDNTYRYCPEFCIVLYIAVLLEHIQYNTGFAEYESDVVITEVTLVYKKSSK